MHLTVGPFLHGNFLDDHVKIWNKVVSILCYMLSWITRFAHAWKRFLGELDIENKLVLFDLY